MSFNQLKPARRKEPNFPSHCQPDARRYGKIVKKQLPRKTANGTSLEVSLTRFADDFIVTASKIDSDTEQQVVPLLEQFLTERE